MLPLGMAAAISVAVVKRKRGRPKKAIITDNLCVDDLPPPAGHLYTAQGVTPLPQVFDLGERKIEFTQTAINVLEKHGLSPAADPSQAECEKWANDVPGIELPMPGGFTISVGNAGDLPPPGVPFIDAVFQPEAYSYPDFQPVLDPLPPGVRWATVIREPANRNMKLVKFLDDGTEDIAWVRSREVERMQGRMEGERLKLIPNPDSFQGGWIQWRG